MADFSEPDRGSATRSAGHDTRRGDSEAACLVEGCGSPSRGPAERETDLSLRTAELRFVLILLD